MYEFSDDVYLEIAERLLEAIGNDDFFSGVVTYDHGDLCCRLRVTVVVRRDKAPCVLPISQRAMRVIPVWWEMQTTIGGSDVMNDFSFSEMLNLVL